MPIRMLISGLGIGGMIAAAITMHSNVLAFIDPGSFAIVVGVSVFGLVWSHPMHEIMHAIRSYLSDDSMTEEAAANGHRVFHRAADLAMASGMLGTLLGLVMMLQNLDDPSAIGPAMAVALLSLTYGVLFGELCCRSVANNFLASTAPQPAQRRGVATLSNMLAILFGVMFTFYLMFNSFCNL